MNRLTMKNAKLNVVLLIFLVTLSLSAQQSTPVSSPKDSKPYQMLVLGDSITWGQGLKKEHKAWYQVKVWLEKRFGRPVVERVQAHSGAVIDGGPTREMKTPESAEVNFGFPSIYEEVDRALRSYSDPSQVDLILLSGCGNDVGTTTFLNAQNSAELNRMTEQKCRSLMESLLRKVTSSFRAAKVIVVGYYPFFSANTPDNFVTRSLARRLIQTTNLSAPKMDSKEIFERLAANSREWYSASDKSFTEAVRAINTELGSERIAFAKIDFLPEYSFGTKQSRLWAFNKSPFRMLLVFLSLGKIELPTDDEVRGLRKTSCNDFYKPPPHETGGQKRERKNRRFLCRYSALGHPNRKGATLYADAIINVLTTSFFTTP